MAGRWQPCGATTTIATFVALESGRRPADHRMMRIRQSRRCSGCSPDGSALAAGRPGASGIVMAQFEGRRGSIGLRQRRKSADRDQQALRGNRISDDDADQRSPETPAYAA